MRGPAIPLYDATQPIVCTLGAADRPARLALLDELRTTLTSIERTEHGLVLRFPPRVGLEAVLRTFTVDEKQCCQFWGFALERTAAGLALRWDGPPAADGLLDALLAWFRGDDPTDALAGLL